MEKETNTKKNNAREKFDNAPVARIVGDEIFEFVEPLNMKKVRAKVIPWMEERGYFRSDYKNSDTGWDNICITRNGVEEGLQHFSGPEKVQSFAALPELIQNGILVESHPGKSKQHGMTEHIFAAKLFIGEKEKLVGFIIKEDAMGMRYYDHEFTNIKNLDGLSSHAGPIGLDTEKECRTRQDSIIGIVKTALLY